MAKNIVDDIGMNMELSRLLGAPLDGIPAKAMDVIKLLIPHLTKHTNPREAAIVMAVVYLFFSAILTSDEGVGKRTDRHDLDTAKELLDAAVHIIGRIGDLDDLNI